MQSLILQNCVTDRVCCQTSLCLFERPVVATLTQPMAWVWGGTVCFTNQWQTGRACNNQWNIILQKFWVEVTITWSLNQTWCNKIHSLLWQETWLHSLNKFMWFKNLPNDSPKEQKIRIECHENKRPSPRFSFHRFLLFTTLDTVDND